MSENAEREMESAVYALAWRVLAEGRNLHILEVEDRLCHMAKSLGCEKPDRELLRRFFLRVLLGICWERLEAVYGFYAEPWAFEQRLDAWVEAMIDIARPLRIVELLQAHCAGNPRLPVIHDIAGQLGARDFAKRPAEEERPCEEGSTPGFARKQFAEWLQKQRNAG